MRKQRHTMRRIAAKAWVSAVCALLLIPSGCSKTPEAPAAVSVEQATPAMQEAFKSAQPEVQTLAQDVVNSAQGQDDARAFVAANELSSKPELTPEQRQAAIQALMAINERLRQAAANGNTAAEKLLETYRATK